MGKRKPLEWDECSDSGYRIADSPCTVRLPCTGEYVPEPEVEFLDISEDIYGRDVLTFNCPKCGDRHESLVLG